MSQTPASPDNPIFAPFVPGVPWEEQDFFGAFCNEKIPEGGKSQYDEPHPVGFHGEGDETGFIFGQAEITQRDWPDFMYLLRAPAERKVYFNRHQPMSKRDGQGNVIRERWPLHGADGSVKTRSLKDFPGVPDAISTNERWDVLEMYRRIHPRLAQSDILMRMRPDHEPRTREGDDRIRDSMNMRAIRRAYPNYHMANWHGKSTQVLPNGLSQEQIDNNTTRGLTPGLIDLTQGEIPGNRIPLPDLVPAALGRQFKGRGRKPREKRAQAEIGIGSGPTDTSSHVECKAEGTIAEATHSDEAGQNVLEPSESERPSKRQKTSAPKEATPSSSPVLDQNSPEICQRESQTANAADPGIGSCDRHSSGEQEFSFGSKEVSDTLTHFDEYFAQIHPDIADFLAPVAASSDSCSNPLSQTLSVQTTTTGLTETHEQQGGTQFVEETIGFFDVSAYVDFDWDSDANAADAVQPSATKDGCQAPYT